MDQAVHALARWDRGVGAVLAAGGAFESVFEIAAHHVAIWDGASWTALGAGVDFPVLALCAFDDGSGPCLYAGGNVPHVGFTGTAALARWDGDDWTLLDGPLQGAPGAAVRALAVFDDGSGPALYVAGDFTSIGALAVGGIARWDGQAWSQVGGGTSGKVEALIVHDDGSGPALYAAGKFDQAGGLTVNHVARWDGVGWSALAGGVWMNSNGGVHALEVFDDGSGPALYAGGYFWISGLPVEGVARWDGSAWAAAGSGLGAGAEVHSLAVHADAAGPALYAGRGTLWKLEGGTWRNLGPALEPSWMSGLLALESFESGPLGGSALIAAGGLSAIAPVIAVGCLALEGGQWTSFGTVPVDLFAKPDNDLALFDDGTGAALFAGGRILQAGQRSAAALLRWDGSDWAAVPGSQAILEQAPSEALCAHPGSAAIEPGLFVVRGGGTCDLLHFDGQTWTTIGPVPGIGGGEGFVTSMTAFDDGAGGGPSLYVAGELNLMPGWSYGAIEWDGAQWIPITQGNLGIVRALAVFDDGGGPALYLGGSYGVSRWDGQALNGVGSIPGVVTALCVYDDGAGPALFAGGDFLEIGGVRVRHIARWNGTDWTEVGGGLSSEADSWAVGALGVFDDGTRPALVVAGQFSAAGGVRARNIAAWDGQAWRPLDAGLGDSIWSKDLIQVDDGGVRTLWVRGKFTTAGSNAAWGVTRWRDECSTAPLAYCTGKVHSKGCLPVIDWSGTPSASTPASFLVSAGRVLNGKPGLFFYGLQGQALLPFQGGVLCVAPPLRRTPVQDSAGHPPPDDCSGALALDFNAWIQSGTDPGLVAGAQVRGQYWFRDPGDPSGTGLTDALAFQIAP